MEDKNLIVEYNITEYLRKLASDEPAPGGGAASALTGAQGAALLIMVTNLTIGKERYKDFQEHNINMRDKAKEIMEKLIKGVDEDKKAYSEVSKAFKLPKKTEKELEIRKSNISDAAIKAAEAPLNVMESAVLGLKIAGSLVNRSNPNLIDDIIVGAIHLNACIDGAKCNIKANIPLIKDKQISENIKKKSEELMSEANDVYNQINKIN